MAYIDDETSVQDSFPSELYEFSAGGAVVARLTSREFDLTYGGNLYLSTPKLERSVIKIPTQDHPHDVTVNLPVSLSFVQTWLLGTPPKHISLTVRRLQSVSGQAEIIAKGRVGNFEISNDVAQVRVPSLLDDALAVQIPCKNFQRQCNHTLYDDMCQIAETDFDVATTVSSFTGTTITVASIGGNPNQWARNGRIKRNDDTEWRLIVSQVGAVLTVNYPFRTLANGNNVTVYAGCDKAVGTCVSKFNNLDNFGGHPLIPIRNPFLEDSWDPEIFE